MKKEKITTWEDITLDQYLQIYQLLQVDDKDEMVFIELLKVVVGEDVEDLPLAKYKEQFIHLDFLKKEMPKVNIKKKYVIKGIKYICNPNLNAINGSQYIDYINYLKENKGVENFAKLVSVFLIPEGKKYNTDYDIDKLIEDIEEEMKIVDVNAISFFLQRQYNAYISIITVYSIQTMKKMMKKEVDPMKKEAIKGKIQEAEALLQSMVY